MATATATAAPTREDFAALLEESFTQGSPQEGTVVKGTIVGIEKDVAVIDVGAKTVEQGGMEFIVRGRGFIGAGGDADQAIEDIEQTVVLTRDGIPVRIRDLADVQLGPDFRRGGLDLNGAEAVEKAAELNPDVLLMDIRMPGMGGLQLQDELKARSIRLPIIIITGYAEVPTAVRALKAGAVDFLEKPFSDQLLVDHVRKAIAADRVARAAEAQRTAAQGRLALLTTREREVLCRVVDGKANKVIAAELGIVEKTVEAHRSRLMVKLAVDSLAGLIRLVQQSQAD